MAPYQSDLPIDPEQLTATGMVAVEWSYLESVMDAGIWQLAGLYDGDAAEAFTAHLQFRPRMDLLATLFSLDVDRDRHHSDHQNQVRRDEFRQIRANIERLSGQRNGIVHARWVAGLHGSPMTYVVQARGSIKRLKKGLPASEIREIAREIAVQASELRTFLGVEVAEDWSGSDWHS